MEKVPANVNAPIPAPAPAPAIKLANPMIQPNIPTEMNIPDGDTIDFIPIIMAMCIPILAIVLIYQIVQMQTNVTIKEGLEIFGIDIGQAIMDYIIDPLYEGLGIKKIVDDILGLVKNVTDIFDMIACPFRILNNIDKCIKYWLIDFLLWIIWAIVFGFLFVTVYLFVLLPAIFLLVYVARVDCEFMKMAGFPDSACSGFINPFDILPSKQTVGRFLEEGIVYLTKKHFFYRNNDDMHKCYCIPGIETACKPLRVRGIETKESKNDALRKNTMALLFAILILILMAAANKNAGAVPSAATALGGPPIPDISELPPSIDLKNTIKI